MAFSVNMLLQKKSNVKRTRMFVLSLSRHYLRHYLLLAFYIMTSGPTVIRTVCKYSK